MELSKYIMWDDIWENEVCLETSIDNLEDDNHLTTIEVIRNFINDNDVELLRDECYLLYGRLYFFFSETGGQTEGDTQGWSRDYSFVVDENFSIINANYEQG
jgi:hypothetical protein